MSKWSDYYEKRMCSPEYVDHFTHKYQTFLDEVLKNKPYTIYEFGCGIGTVALALNRQGYDQSRMTLSDICPDMLEAAIKNLQHFNILMPEIRKSNVLEEVYAADICISHGVLEHFDNKDIRNIIKRQMKYCDEMVHCVPSNRYEKPSFGDERLMSVGEWFNITNPTYIHEFNDGYDLALVWRKQK